MNEAKFKQLALMGVTQSDALEYAAKLAQTGKIDVPRLFLRQENWVITPLPVVYFGAKNRMLSLPFLDTTRLDKVFGVEVDGVPFSKNDDNFNLPHETGWIGVNNALKEMTEKIFGDGSFGRPSFAVPYLNDMQNAYTKRELLNETMRIFRSHGLSADNWSHDPYAAEDVCKKGDYPHVVDMSTGVISEYDSSSDTPYHMRFIIRCNCSMRGVPVTEEGLPNWEKLTAGVYEHLFE
ncbi:MAG: hypothetical protein J6N49_02420 [Alphaproteobacteria bacterium]|nr:hypothetical protein [Alphaproteobacteria bacterium]